MDQVLSNPQIPRRRHFDSQKGQDKLHGTERLRVRKLFRDFRGPLFVASNLLLGNPGIAG